MKRDLRSTRVENEPPSVTEYSSATDVDTDNHIPEEQPLANKRLTAVSGRQTHNRTIGRVESKGSGRQTIGY